MRILARLAGAAQVRALDREPSLGSLHADAVCGRAALDGINERVR
jgi:hypothetical protein